jgi:hypothetical protein
MSLQKHLKKDFCHALCGSYKFENLFVEVYYVSHIKNNGYFSSKVHTLSWTDVLTYCFSKYEQLLDQRCHAGGLGHLGSQTCT